MVDGDGLEFFARHGRLTVRATEIGPGECPCCRRGGQMLYQNGSFKGCRACAPIRMAYAYEDNKFSLGGGDYAVISAAETVYFSNLDLPNVKRRPAMKAEELYPFLYRLCTTDHPSPYLLVHFGKATPTRGTFHVNPAGRPDFLLMSGNPLIGSFNAAAINARVVRELHQNFPQIGGKDWPLIIGIQQALRDRKNGNKAFELREEYAQKLPGIFESELPEPRSVEAKILEVIGNDQSIRGPSSGKSSRRKPVRRRAS